jgi:tRNA(fMet)-specific endonuclease VapC
MRNILLDTNAYVAFKRGQTEAANIVQRATSIALTTVVIGELLAGFAAGSREARNRTELQQFLDVERVRIFPVDQATAEYYATVYRTLRSKGQPIPTNDMWIAASALQYGYALFSYDSHFQHVDGVIVGATPAELLL